MTIIMADSQSHLNVDGGWAWVVLCVAYLSMVLYGIVQFSTGIIVTSILDDMTDNYSLASSIGSTHIACMFLTGPFAGIINDKLGCRKTGVIGGFIMFIGLSSAWFATSVWSLALTYGVLGGIGYGMMYNTCFVACGHYFHRLRSVTAGFVSSGIAVGIFIGPIIVRSLINKYHLNGMFLILGATSLNAVPLAMLIRPTIFENKVQTIRRESADKMTNMCKTGFLNMVRNKAFLFCSLSIFSWSAWETVCVIQMPVYAVQQGSTKMQAATLFTAFGGGSLLARCLTGLTINDEGINKSLIQGSFLGISAILTLLYPSFSNSFLGQMIYAGAVGLFNGGIPALISPLVIDILGVPLLATGFGVISMISGITYIILPTISGLIIQETGCTTCVFYIAGCILLFGSLMALLSGTILQKTHSTINDDNTTVIVPITKTPSCVDVKLIDNNHELCPLKSTHEAVEQT